MISNIQRIKNPQTFIDFVRGIKEEEIEKLNNISFKGMDSAINLGLVSALESVEASEKIKKIIAEKMLEIITPNKKWDEKMHEKYKKLLLLAGKEKG